MYEAIDHRITRDPGGRGSQLLYDAARTEHAEALVQQAATRLKDAIKPEQPVLLTTGFPISPSNQPETDGPLGAAVLAKAVTELGGQPVFVVDSQTRPVIEAVAVEIGVEPTVELLSTTAPDGATEAAAQNVHPAETLLSTYEPAAIVAVEKPGRTADGTYRNMAGDDITDSVAPVDDLFDRAAEHNVLTIGVGDGGNEIGMGSIRPAVEAHVKHGETIASVTCVDELVVAGVSNWGAYGIVAALSLSTGQNLLHTGATERRLLATCVESGAIDGVHKQPTLSVDGIQCGVHERTVDDLHEICATALA